MAAIRFLVIAIVGLVLSAPAFAQYSSSRSTGWEFGLQAVYLDSTDVTFDGGTRSFPGWLSTSTASWSGSRRA